MPGLDRYRGARVGVLGMARSGLALTRALVDAGAAVLAWDDKPAALEAALRLGARPGTADDVPTLGMLVVSPGVPLTHPAPHPLVAAARAAGITVTGDVELFAQVAAPRPIVGITGTNGKSTTTALVHHLLVAAGRPALMGGNIGRPVFELELGREDQTIVLELSSYQLDLCEHLRCRVAVWLNLTPDHLDRHGSLEGYIAAKRRIFENQTADDVAVIGVDDAPSRAVAAELRAQVQRVVEVSVGRELLGGVGVVQGRLLDGLDGPPRPVASVEGLERLRGAHNHQNLAVAYATVRALGLDPDEALRGLPTFQGLAHRMEEVGRIGAVRFVNDSKATNPDSATKSLDAFERIYWIAGGKPKPGGFADLVPHLGQVRHAYLIGEAAPAMAAELGAYVPVTIADTLERALEQAHRAAEASGAGGAVVLLAPACASFDQFRDFEARGDAFRRLVKERQRAAESEAAA